MHYVGLDPIVSSTTPVSTNNVSCNDNVSVTQPQNNNSLPGGHSDPTNTNNSVNDDLSDVEKGNEHLRQISGGAPMTSMLS